MQRRWCHLLAACPIPSPRWREKDSNPRSPARETTLRDCLLIEEVRFALDSPLEGDGFEPSVPRQKDNTFETYPRAVHRTDSPVEGPGFEPSVPVRGAASRGR